MTAITAPRPRTLAIACGLAVAALAVPDASADPAHERKLRLAGIASAMALYIAGETIGKDALSPDSCRWCTPPGFDKDIAEAAHWEHHEELARDLSNIVGYGLVPVGGALLLLAASADAPAGSRWSQYGDDVIAMFEIVWYTQIPTVLMKITAARERPFVNAGGGNDPPHPEENLSFWSGHAALTFSIGVGAGMLAQRRGYRLAPVIWAAGVTAAAATAYFRMAADRHYLTDVVTGGAVGALAGIFIPRLTGSLPARATLVPQPGGLALTGAF